MNVLGLKAGPPYSAPKSLMTIAKDALLRSNTLCHACKYPIRDNVKCYYCLREKQYAYTRASMFRKVLEEHGISDLSSVLETLEACKVHLSYLSGVNDKVMVNLINAIEECQYKDVK